MFKISVCGVKNSLSIQANYLTKHRDLCIIQAKHFEATLFPQNFLNDLASKIERSVTAQHILYKFFGCLL